jgi:hypothetical protein
MDERGREARRETQWRDLPPLLEIWREELGRRVAMAEEKREEQGPACCPGGDDGEARWRRSAASQRQTTGLHLLLPW